MYARWVKLVLVVNVSNSILFPPPILNLIIMIIHRRCAGWIWYDQRRVNVDA